MMDFYEQFGQLLNEYLFQKENKDDKSYYYSVNKKWENDKLVSSHEEEYKNGRCVKCEGFDSEKLTDNKESKCTSGCKCSCNKDNMMTTESESAENMRKEIMELKKTNMKLQEENTILKCKMNKIKNMF